MCVAYLIDLPYTKRYKQRNHICSHTCRRIPLLGTRRLQMTLSAELSIRTGTRRFNIEPHFCSASSTPNVHYYFYCDRMAMLCVERIRGDAFRSRIYLYMKPTLPRRFDQLCLSHKKASQASSIISTCVVGQDDIFGSFLVGIVIVQPRECYTRDNTLRCCAASCDSATRCDTMR